MACADPYERAWRFVSVQGEHGCWIWTGSTSGSKGARPSFRPTTGASDPKVYVYRWMWERQNGPVPDGLELDHFRCQNRMCVNPSHVEPVTPEENARRTRRPCAEGHDEWVFDVLGRRRGCAACARERNTLSARERRARRAMAA